MSSFSNLFGVVQISAKKKKRKLSLFVLRVRITVVAHGLEVVIGWVLSAEEEDEEDEDKEKTNIPKKGGRERENYVMASRFQVLKKK